MPPRFAGSGPRFYPLLVRREEASQSIFQPYAVIRPLLNWGTRADIGKLMDLWPMVSIGLQRPCYPDQAAPVSNTIIMSKVT